MTKKKRGIKKQEPLIIVPDAVKEEMEKKGERIRGQVGLSCRRCGCPTSSVYETRRSRLGTRRRRICDNCGLRYSTTERENE